jgi:outer membrane autotransporter protein
LTINGTDDSSFSGTFSGSGSLNIQNGSVSLSNSGNEKVALTIKNATVSQNATTSSTVSLRSLAIRAASSSSTISYQSLLLQQGAHLSVGSSTSPGQTLSIGSGGLTVESGATLTFYLATESAEDFIDNTPLVSTTGSITLQSGATIQLLDETTIVSAKDKSLKATLMTGTSAASVGTVSLQAPFLSTVYENLTLLAEGNNVVLTGNVREDNIFESPQMTPNSSAGAHLLWEARFSMLSGESILKDAYLSISEMIDLGNRAGANKALAALAGSTITATGVAQRHALQSQLLWLRNRTVTMGLPEGFIYDDLPYYHMWIEGMGASSKLNTDGDEGGYKLNSWGGTIGFDLDLTPDFTLGVAFTATWGDLSSSAAEYASGNLDSYYVSLFARYQHKEWAHTFILSGSWDEATLDRFVSFGSVSYKPQGATKGSGFGALYELSYDIPLNEDRSSLLQPLFNASLVRSSMKGYSETVAGNAGLKVGKQEATLGELALGLRWLGIVGTDLFGREALLELSANIAQDLGNAQGKASVSLLGNPQFAQSVYGAKDNKTAFQVGLGLSLPVNQQGTFFCQGNGNLRAKSHDWNASMGYSYSF